MAQAGRPGVRNKGGKGASKAPASSGGKKPSGSVAGQRPPSPKNRKPQKDEARPRLRFLTSAADLRGCPQDKKPEVALVGRSNSGKSSLLNALGNERVAKVSSTPGKTRLLNFFEAGQSYRYVDMPGYGWSARGGEEHHSWRPMIEAYLTSRANLTGLLILMDIRRDWSEDEELLVRWMAPTGLPAAIVLTKADKLSRNEAHQRMTLIQRASGIGDIFVTSASKKEGFTELEDFVFKSWVKPRLGK